MLSDGTRTCPAAALEREEHRQGQQVIDVTELTVVCNFASELGDIDHLLALAMLFTLEGRRQIRVPSLSTSRFNPAGSAIPRSRRALLRRRAGG